MQLTQKQKQTNTHETRTRVYVTRYSLLKDFPDTRNVRHDKNLPRVFLSKTILTKIRSLRNFVWLCTSTSCTVQLRSVRVSY